MFLIIGLVIVFGSVIGGYLMHHGQIMVLMQYNEFLILGGAALGSFMMANPPSVLKGAIRETVGLLKPNPFNKAAYAELLQVLYEVFQTTRKGGMTALEPHVEDPAASAIFQKYPNFMHHQNAVALFCDTMKVLLIGAVEEHNLDAMLDADLEKQAEEAHVIPDAITTVGDAMPGFGIVAAVLGVIITMGSIGGEASEIGEKVAAALVGTFLGILLAYGVFGPIAKAITGRHRAEHAYLHVIKTAILAQARGDAPLTAVEFARRSIEPEHRPSFKELEDMTRRKAS